MQGFPSALGRSQKQKRAKKWAQMLSNAPKSPKTKIHVAVDASIKCVVENKLAKPYKQRACKFFATYNF